MRARTRTTSARGAYVVRVCLAFAGAAVLAQVGCIPDDTQELLNLVTGMEDDVAGLEQGVAGLEQGAAGMEDEVANLQKAVADLQEGKGTPGPAGDRGPKGDVGAKGDAGPKGDKPQHQWSATSLRFENPNGSWGTFVNLKGPKGDKGEKGDNKPDHRWVDTTWLQFEKPNGTWGEKVDLKGPKGDKGDQGTQGGQGPKGDKPAHQWVETTKLQFEKPDGSWADPPVELKGPKGDKGDTGAPGPKGDKPNHRWVETTKLQFEKPDGSWADPPVELKGPKGDQGIQGIQGPKGDKPNHEWSGTSLRFEKPDGSWGTSVNLKGDKGDPGPKGDTGDPGVPWSLNGNKAYYNGGNVGIGTSDPSSKLYIDASGSGMSVYTSTGSSQAIWAEATSTSGSPNSIYAQNRSSGGACVYANASSSSGTNVALRGHTASSSGYAVYATGGKNYFQNPVGIGVTPQNDYQLYVLDSDGISGALRASTSQSGAIGAIGASTSTSGPGWGGGFYTSSNSSSAYGIYAAATSPAKAGYFSGNVTVTGTLSKGGGSFKIDHPLDPENKYLYHSFVESPDMKNIYDGTVALDDRGEAWVALPEWFDALNRDMRYQLTCIGGYAPVYVADEARQGRFRIAGGKPGLKVSWQVTGIRQDAFANANRIPIEEDKPAEERGRYLHPEAIGKPREFAVDYLAEKTLRDVAPVPNAPADDFNNDGDPLP